MRLTTAWRDFEIVTMGNGTKIERYGTVLLQRPEPLASMPLHHAPKVDAAFIDHHWQVYTSLPESMELHYRDMKLLSQLTTFKHTGVFPEQGINWDFMRHVLDKQTKPVRVLNLFGYTGGATVACALSDCVEEVVHVDALKSALHWTQTNLKLNHLEHKKVRVIQDDVLKFIQREKRRGRTYQAIIMDPPSFGHGPQGERWQIQELLPTLIQAVLDIFAEDGLFIVINTYSTALKAATVLELLQSKMTTSKGGFDAQDLGLPVTSGGVLKCGAATRWCYDENLL